MLRHRIISLFAGFILTGYEFFLCAADVKIVDFSKGGWSQFRGPRRDGICDETGLLRRWDNGEPKVVFSIKNLGRGYSSPVFDGQKFFITGDINNDLVIFAFDLNGKFLWKTTNGAAWKGPYQGSRASCVVDEKRLYNINAHGRLGCFNTENGQEIWSVNLLEKYEGKEITWGLGECPVVDENFVYAIVGGARGLMVAFNKTNGAPVWTSEPLRLGENNPPQHERVSEPAGEVDSASYSSPVMFELNGVRYITGCSLRHIFIINAKTGKLVCTRPMPTRYQVIASMPVLINNLIFFTAPDAGGGSLYRIEPSRDGVILNKIWTTPLDTCHGGVVAINNALYGSFYRDKKGWGVVSLKDGSLLYHLKTIPMGSLLYADGRLYCLSQEGDMALIEPKSDSLEIISQFKFVQGNHSDVWAHPVIYKKRMYLRYHDSLYCYNVSE
ncbi:MAG: PQQ-binding-like beta-propeller repeat protein [Verrucomicrobiia bacterium]